MAKDKIASKESQNGCFLLDLAPVIIVVGTAAIGYNLYESGKNEAAAQQAAEQQALADAHQAQVNKIAWLKEIDSRRPAVAIMPHPNAKGLRTTAASLNIPIKTAKKLTDPYGEITDGYTVSMHIPSLGANEQVNITPESSGWVESLLKSQAVQNTAIVPDRIYAQSIADMQEKLTSISGKSSVNIKQGDVEATILIPDAVAYAIKNSKSRRPPSPDDIKAALGNNSFPVEVASVSTKSMTNTSGQSHSRTRGKSSSSGFGGGVGVVLGPVLLGGGGSSSKGTSTSDTDGSSKEKSETTSEPNFVTGSHVINLSEHSSLLNSILTAQTLRVSPDFSPKQHKEIVDNLKELEATQNKLSGNKKPISNYNNAAAPAFKIPLVPSEDKNLLSVNGSMSDQFIVNTYGKNFGEVKKDIEEAVAIAIKSGKVPVLVGVSYPKEIMDAQENSNLFNPRDPKHIKQAMGSDEAFPLTVSVEGNVKRTTITPEDFAKHLPQKVMEIIKLSREQQVAAR